MTQPRPPRICPRFEVRVALPIDRDAVARLLERSYPALMAGSYEPSVLAAALPLMTQAQPPLLASGTFFVAVVDGGAVIGCGGWTPEQPGRDATVEAGLGHIRHFGVDPDWTRQGVASAIMSTCIDSARQHGIVRLQCMASINAEKFYVSAGFVATGRRVVMLGNTIPFPSVNMQWSI
ncbi:MAG: GNAT family N-acetyltransferase [Hyphomicrobium sp.]|nr:MAG: GNAT family N-acetyltransferase [Hyphomicrobium sp.]